MLKSLVPLAHFCKVHAERAGYVDTQSFLLSTSFTFSGYRSGYVDKDR